MRKFNSLVASVRTISEKTRGKNTWKLNFRAFVSHIFAKFLEFGQKTVAKLIRSWGRIRPIRRRRRACSRRAESGPCPIGPPGFPRRHPGRWMPWPPQRSRASERAEAPRTGVHRRAFSPKVAFTGHGGRLNRPRPSHWPNVDRYSSVLADRM